MDGHIEELGNEVRGRDGLSEWMLYELEEQFTNIYLDYSRIITVVLGRSRIAQCPS